MKISKKSWHYRYLDWCGKRPWACNTHCEYWMKLATTPVFACIKWVLYIAGGLLVICGVIGTIHVLVLGPLFWATNLIFGWNPWDIGFTNEAMIVLGIFVFIVGVVLSIVYGIDRIPLITTAISDYRDKTCTRITFKD